jgi:pimeloyl-ACP methyl ester carboxylesterase
MRNWKRVALVVSGLLFALVFLGVPYLVAYLVTHAGTRPQDQRLSSTPADHGVRFEEVTFRNADGHVLSGWYLGGADSDVAVAVGHGLFRSRREVLDRAAFFRERGYDTIVFDFRRHGESSGDRITLGFWERSDFLAARDFLASRGPRRSVVFYGVSMGAAAALLAASDSPDAGAVVADSPFVSIEDTVVRHVELLLGLPRFPFASALLFFLELQGNFDRTEFDLERAARAMGDRPVLIVAGAEDARMPPELQARIYRASSAPESRFVSVPEAGHGASYRTDPDSYERAVADFLENAGLRPGPRKEGEGVYSSPGSR